MLNITGWRKEEIGLALQYLAEFLTAVGRGLYLIVCGLI